MQTHVTSTDRMHICKIFEDLQEDKTKF